MRGRIVAGALLIVAAGGIASFYGISRANNKPAAEKERVVHPERRKIGAVVNATGVVRLRVGSEVRVGSQLSGIVEKLNVTVGAHVEEGEVIAELDDRMTEARIADSAAQAELDRASMERARVSYERARVLGSKKVIAAQEEEDLRLALAEAKARYEKSLRACELVKVDLNYINIRA
ncbi:MAG TPA: biotin/lipoyl-binding protein, partial [Candidatus Udaeobacter sp.]